MADSVHILNGDELDTTLLGEALGRAGISDYVARGIIPDESGVDFGAAVVDIPAGKAFLLDAGRDAMLLPDARAGVPLATDGTNHVFIYYDLSRDEGERIGYHVDSDGTPPTDPSLEIAEIDMSARTVTPRNDTAPVYRRDAETYKGNDLDPDGDGVVNAADEAFLVQGTNVSGAVGLADVASLVQGTDVSGEVQAAAYAGTAGVADEAGKAGALDGDAGGRSGVAEVASDVEMQWHWLLNVARTQIRRPADHNTGLDIYGSSAGDFELLRLVPVKNSAKKYGDEFRYEEESGRWHARGGLRSAGNVVLDTGDESSLDVATADTAATLGGRSGEQLLTLQSASIPSAVFDDGESAWVPIHAPNTIRVLSVALWNDDYDAPSGLRVNIQTPSGGVYQQDGDAHVTGGYDAPVKIVGGGEARVRMLLTNDTGTKQVAGAAIRYIEER